jgi:hypothetical protein
MSGFTRMQISERRLLDLFLHLFEEVGVGSADSKGFRKIF